MEAMTDNTVAILGGGFGGLRTALDLARGLRKNGLAERYKTVLIDRSPFHVYTALLYKYAARTDFPREALAQPFKDLVSGTSLEFTEDSLAGLDLEKGLLKLGSGRELHAGYIVLAPGSETNWFGITGLKENSLPLKTLDDAEKIRARAKLLAPGAKALVGGGGPTGLELAAELRKARGFEVAVVEAMPTLLPGFRPGLQKAAAKRLRKLGVEVLLNEPVMEVKPDAALTKTGKKLPFDLFVWTGGTEIPAWVKNLPLQTEAKGRLMPDAGMECLPQSPDLALTSSVYALGDAVCVHMKDGSAMPGVARAAIQEGKVAAENVLKDILAAEGLAKESRHATYHPMHYPYVLPLGGHYAIGNIGPVILKGLPAWLFKEAIEMNYLISILPPGATLRIWRQGI